MSPEFAGAKIIDIPPIMSIQEHTITEQLVRSPKGTIPFHLFKH